MKKVSILCLIVSMALLGCGIIPSPENAYKRIVEYAQKNDWGAVYDSFDSYTKGQIDAGMKMVMSFALAFADDKTKKEFDGLSGRNIFIKMSEDKEFDTKDYMLGSENKIIKTKKEGDKVILIIKDSQGNLDEIAMVLENRKWKLHIDWFEETGQKETALSPKKQKLTIAEKIERKKQEKLAQEAREKERAEKEELKQTVRVALIEKSFVESDWQRGIHNDYITIKLVLSNERDKDIKAVKGLLIFKDVFGDEIYSASFKYDKGIKVKTTKHWDGQIDYNQFSDADKKLRITELRNLIFEWEPQTILFEDGSKLGE